MAPNDQLKIVEKQPVDDSPPFPDTTESDSDWDEEGSGAQSQSDSGTENMDSGMDSDASQDDPESDEAKKAFQNMLIRSKLPNDFEDELFDDDWDDDPSKVNTKFLIKSNDTWDADVLFQTISDKHNLTKAARGGLLQFFHHVRKNRLFLSETLHQHLKKVDNMIRIKSRRIVKCLECGKTRKFKEMAMDMCPCKQEKANPSDINRSKECQIIIWMLRDLLQQLTLSKYYECRCGNIFIHCNSPFNR